MSVIETAVYRLVGIKPESQGIRWYSVAFFELFAKVDRLRNGTTYEGVLLPEEGAVFLVSNHTSMLDSAKGYRVGQRSGRIPRTYTRDSLLDPTKKDSEQVLARAGHKSDILNSAPMFLRRMIAAIPTGVEAIPVTRGGGRQDVDDFLVRGGDKFNAGLVVACFTQETRNKEGRLVNPIRGVALLAKANPDVPIYPMGISKRKPHRVSIGEPFTYNQMLKDPEYADLTRSNFTVVINDRIANQLDPDIRQDWYEVQRPLLLNRRRATV